MAVRQVIEASYVLPEPNAASLIENGAVAVTGTRIDDVGTAAELRARWADAPRMAFPGGLLMPGLVNAHQHGRGLSQIQLGFPDDFLEPWIAGRRARGILDGHAVTRLAAARMIANGVTTTIHANYSYGTGDYEREVRDQIAAYDEIGIRATMCVGAMDQGSIVYPPHESCFMAGLRPELRDWLAKSAGKAYAGDAAATIALMDRLQAALPAHDRIRLCYGPAGPQWVSDAMWQALATDAAAKGLGLHLHALESPAQRRAARELYPGGVFQHLARLGALGPRTVIAHGVWVEDRDMEALARADATAVRNPGCNIRMRNGIAPLADYLRHGVRVAIGTDNCAMNDDEDLLSELRLAGSLARTPEWNGPPPPSTDALLAMATVNGAVAAQFAGEIGRLSPGLRADLAVFSLTRLHNPYLAPDMPVLDAFLARGLGQDTQMTMVDGRILYSEGRYTDLKLEALEEAAAEAARAAFSPTDSADPARTAELRSCMGAHYRGLATAASDHTDSERS